MFLVNLQTPYLLPVTIVVVFIPPINAHSLMMKRNVRRLKKLARIPPLMVVVDKEVVVIVVVEVAVVVAEINEVVGIVPVTQQRMLILEVSSASTMYG